MIELGCTRCGIANSTGDEDSGIVHEYVESAESLSNSSDKTGYLSGICLIGLNGFGTATLTFDFLNDGLCFCGRGGIADGYLGAIFCKPFGDGRANSARSAR